MGDGGRGGGKAEEAEDRLADVGGGGRGARLAVALGAGALTTGKTKCKAFGDSTVEGAAISATI